MHYFSDDIERSSTHVHITFQSEFQCSNWVRRWSRDNYLHIPTIQLKLCKKRKTDAVSNTGQSHTKVVESRFNITEISKVEPLNSAEIVLNLAILLIIYFKKHD